MLTLARASRDPSGRRAPRLILGPDSVTLAFFLTQTACGLWIKKTSPSLFWESYRPLDGPSAVVDQGLRLLYEL